jgi:hypothetical protein
MIAVRHFLTQEKKCGASPTCHFSNSCQFWQGFNQNMLIPVLVLPWWWQHQNMLALVLDSIQRTPYPTIVVMLLYL